MANKNRFDEKINYNIMEPEIDNLKSTGDAKNPFYEQEY